MEKNNVEIHTFSDLMGREYPPMEWLVENLVPTASVIAISGYPASYKTWFVLDLALKVVKGEPLFGKFPTGQTGVMLIDEENGERSLQRRFKILKAERATLPLFWTSLNEFKLSEKTVDHLIKSAKERGVGLVIFDSLVRIHSNDENSAREMAQVSSLLKRFTKDGISVIFTHHHRKAGQGQVNHSHDMRGSSDLLASVESHIALQRKANERIVNVIQTKLRDSEETKPFQLELLSDGQYRYFSFCGYSENKRDSVKEEVLKVLDGSVDLYAKDILKRLKERGIKLGNSTLRTALSEMVVEGDLHTEPGTGSGTLYSLPKVSV